MQRNYLSSAMKLLTYCATMYRPSDDEAKRLANQDFFEKIYIGEDEQLIVRTEPFNELTPDTLPHVGGSNTSTMVELRGLEPLTLCMPCRCATSCATAPCDHHEDDLWCLPRGNSSTI